MYAADEAIEPGTVVMFGGEGKVEACDAANCRAVAGIISTDPAHLMNSTQEGVALALAGRVPCKVIGPIKKGQRLVSSEEAGVARGVSTRFAGENILSIIGRSLEEDSRTEERLIEIAVGVK